MSTSPHDTTRLLRVEALHTIHTSQTNKRKQPYIHTHQPHNPNPVQYSCTYYVLYYTVLYVVPIFSFTEEEHSTTFHFVPNSMINLALTHNHSY